MSRGEKNIILVVLLFLFLFAYGNDCWAGFAGPIQTIEIIQPEPDIGFEIWKWSTGVSTVVIGVWLTYYLNNKKKKNND